MHLFKTYQNQFIRLTILIFLGMVLCFGFKYAIDRSNIRNAVLKSIQSGISPEILVNFVFSETEADNLNWKKSHEFELNGEMYDVVEHYTENGKHYYACFHDTKETKYKRRFYKFLGRLLLPEHEQNSDENNWKSSQKVQFSETPFSIVPNGFVQLSTPIFGHVCAFYSFFVLGPNAPPPQL